MMPNQPSEFTDEGGKSELQEGTPGHAPPFQTMHKYHTYHFPRSPNYASLSTATRATVLRDRHTPLFSHHFLLWPDPNRSAPRRPPKKTITNGPWEAAFSENAGPRSGGALVPTPAHSRGHLGPSGRLQRAQRLCALCIVHVLLGACRQK